MKKRGKAQTNFNDKLPQPQDELAQEILKGPLITFPFQHCENHTMSTCLKKPYEHNIRRFLLELGYRFCIRWKSDGTFACLVEPATFRIWYSIIQKLKCYVVLELKVVKF